MIKLDFSKIQDEEEKQFLKQLTAGLDHAEYQNRVSYTHFYSLDWVKGVCEKYLGGVQSTRYVYFWRLWRS